MSHVLNSCGFVARKYLCGELTGILLSVDSICDKLPCNAQFVGLIADGVFLLLLEDLIARIALRRQTVATTIVPLL
ncbi:hypothetical protein ACNKHQ_17740 [Shigella flexneri]